jgi:hypothetical protein
MLLLATPLTGPMAQEMPQLRPDARVRITVPTVVANRIGDASSIMLRGINDTTIWIIGNVVSWNTSSIALQGISDTAIVTVPLMSVHRIEVSEGRRVSVGRVVAATFIGLFAGAVIGGLIGHAAEGPFSGTAEMKALGGIVLGGFGGALAGGIIGARHRVERWEAMSLPGVRQGLGPGQSRPFMLSVTWQF